MALSDRARLAVNLKIAREAAGISQTAAGEAVKKSRGTIVNWENPENLAEPDSDEVAVLATLYRLTPRDLRFAELAKPAAAIVSEPRQGPSIIQEPPEDIYDQPIPARKPRRKGA